MTLFTTKRASLCSFQYYFRSLSSFSTLEKSVQAAFKAKTYDQIPDLLIASKESLQNPNPFSFLSTFSNLQKTQIISEILHSFISIKPRNCPQIAYSCLLSYTLQNPNPFPISLAIVQRILRSGFSPNPQTRLSLSNAWLNQRQRSNSVSKIFLEMKSIGYNPDTETCNYVIGSLCDVDQLTEAVNVLKSMHNAGCVPDLESYDLVIRKMCKFRKIKDVFETIKTMVEKIGLAPKEATILKAVKAMRAQREIRRGVEVIELLEKANLFMGFEIYEIVLESCLQYRDYVLAGKVVMRMAAQGFIPYVEARLKVVEGLASVGELGFASAVRQKFVELNS